MAKNKENASFRSFGDLGKKMGIEPTPELSPTQELFQKVLAGKFDKVAKGNFESKALPPIASVTLLPFHNEATGQRIIYATMFYDKPGNKEGQVTWSIFENGIISGQMPSDLPLQDKRKEIELELLSIIEKVNLDFWHQTNVPIGLDEDEGQKREAPTGSISRREGRQDLERPERLEFYENLPGVLFGSVSKSSGFDGYKFIVFRGTENDFFILDKEYIKNAAFIIDLPPEQRIVFEQAAVEKEREEILIKYWLPLREKAAQYDPIKKRSRITRQSIRDALGAKKIVHNDTWEKRMAEEIKKRVGSSELATV